MDQLGPWMGLVLTLMLAACGSSSSSPTPQPEPRRVAGGFFAFGTSPKFNVPDERGVTPCDGALEILSGSAYPSFNTLYRLDGDDWTCVQRFVDANADRPHEVRVYLYYDIVKQPTLDELLERDDEVRAKLADLMNDRTLVTIVPVLEDRMTDAEFEQFLRSVESAPRLTIERNPLHPGADAFGLEKEAHGRGTLCGGDTVSASQDGAVFTDAESLSWVHDNANCERLILWAPEWQDLCVVDNEPIKCRPISDRTPRIERVEFYRQLMDEASR